MEFLETVWDFWMNWTSSLDWIKSDVFCHIYFSLLKMGLIFIVNRLCFSFVRIPLLKLLAFHWLCMIFLWFFNDRWYAYKTDEIDRTNAHEISYDWIQNWMVRYVFVINISNIFFFSFTIKILQWIGLTRPVWTLKNSHFDEKEIKGNFH